MLLWAGWTRHMKVTTCLHGTYVFVEHPNVEEVYAGFRKALGPRLARRVSLTPAGWQPPRLLVD